MTPRRVWGIAAILLAVICGLAMLGVAASGFGSQSAFTSPGPVTANLTAGKWTVFQLLASDAQGTLPSDFVSQRTVESSQVRVTGPDGKPVAVSCAYCGSDQAGVVPLDLRIALPIADFDAPVSGDYTVTVDAPSPTMLALGNPIQRLTALTPWLSALMFVSALLLIGGVILVATGGRRGAGPPLPPPPPSVPPPGWYPNPYRPEAGQMWWDGKQWTSNWR